MDSLTLETEVDRAHRRAFGNYSEAEWHALPIWARLEAMDQRKRDWIKGIAPTPFIEANNPEPILRGSAAIGAAHVSGLETFHRMQLVEQARSRTLSGIQAMLGGRV